MRNCVFERVGFGVKAVETEAQFNSNTYLDTRVADIFVSPPLGKSKGQGIQGEEPVPLLGDETIEGTGGNVFRGGTGNFIMNTTSTI